MRSKTMIPLIIPLLALTLLSGCLGPEYLTTRTPSEPSALEETASLRDPGLHYTSHPGATARPEIVALIVAETFSLHERAKILRGVNEWNVALNGFVRFEIMSNGNHATTGANLHWTITSQQGGQNSDTPTTLGATYPAVGIGGLMVIHVGRIGRRDLGGVVMHELGHVLGLGHNPKGGLMAAHYHPTSQQCIDRATVEAVAAKRGLPAASLNWCEDGGVASASGGSTTQAANRATR
jgi:Matrixin